MNTRKIATEYRLSQWAQSMQERATSGESIEDFCKRKGISRNTFFYWQRKLREAACQALKIPQEAQSEALVPSGWAVCSSEPEVEDVSGSVTIEIGKCRITATSSTDAELLGKVCRVLMSQC